MRRGHRFFLEKETCRGLRPQPVLTGGSALPSPPWGLALEPRFCLPAALPGRPGAWGLGPRSAQRGPDLRKPLLHCGLTAGAARGLVRRVWAAAPPVGGADTAVRRAELSVAGQASPGPKRAPTLPHTLLAPQGWVLLGLSDVMRAAG